MPDRIKFTKRTLDALSLPEGTARAVYHDSEVRGLELRVTASGRKTFSVRRRVKNSALERFTIGTYPDISVEQAQRKALELIGRFAAGDSPAAERRAKRGEMTLAEAFSHYMADRENKRKRPEKIRYEFEQYLGDFAGRKLSAINNAEVTRWHHSIPAAINKRRERNRQEFERARAADPAVTRPRGIHFKPVDGRRTANMALVRLHAILEFARKKQWISHNPAEGVERFPEVSRSRFLKGDELRRFFEALALEQNEAIRDFFAIALLTGARRANVLSMRWADLDLQSAEWAIPGETLKNGEQLTVPLVPEAIAILQARKAINDALEEKERSPFVFPGTGSKGHIVEPKMAWQRLLGRANIEDVRIHDLRRTLGAHLAGSGANMPVSMQALGHKTTAAALVYQRLTIDPVRKAVNTAVSDMLAAAFPKAQQPAKVMTLADGGKR
ncbi:MAG: tyrosine-type recombinase/integrase [Betaproteobacteria bacterium]|nr:tyrosine-type recombinase/integrase [Betaproteobacteria bacterium]